MKTYENIQYSPEGSKNPTCTFICNSLGLRIDSNLFGIQGFQRLKIIAGGGLIKFLKFSTSIMLIERIHFSKDRLQFLYYFHSYIL